MHSEPANALSIPTWAIHFSSVFEFLFAMDVIWKFAEATDNPKWKGLTWGMLPLHASGICACTYHFFYNPGSLQFLVELQAFLTLLGNTTVALAAYRIATSNGWTLKELNPFPKGEVSPDGIALDEAAALPYATVAATESEAALFAKLTALTLGCSYLLKYGELAFDLPLTENGLAAGAIVAGVPAATAYFYYNRGQEEGGAGLTLPKLPGFSGEDGKGGLSMADVKKYGVSGTVAYVLTELAVRRAVPHHGALARRGPRHGRSRRGAGVRVRRRQRRPRRAAVAARRGRGAGAVGRRQPHQSGGGRVTLFVSSRVPTRSCRTAVDVWRRGTRDVDSSLCVALRSGRRELRRKKMPGRGGAVARKATERRWRRRRGLPLSRSRGSSRSAPGESRVGDDRHRYEIRTP
jgi:hypothetical protein